MPLQDEVNDGIAETGEDTITSNSDNTAPDIMPIYPGDDYVEPTPQPLSPEEMLRIMFGTDEVMIEKDTYEGKSVFKVTYIDPYACQGDNAQNGLRDVISFEVMNGSPLTVVSMVDPESLDILSYRSYQGAVGDENLVAETSYQFTQKDVPFSEVADNFTYNIPVEIRDVIVPAIEMEYGSEEYFSKFRLALSESGLLVVIPSDMDGYTTGGAGISSMWDEESDYVSFYQDREFYVPGLRGDELFESFNPDGYAEGNYIAPLYTDNIYPAYTETEEQSAASFSSLQIEIYEPVISYEQLVSSRFSSENGITISKIKDVNLTINGSGYQGELYRYDYKDRGMEPLSTESTNSTSDPMVVREDPGLMSLLYMVRVPMQNQTLVLNYETSSAGFIDASFDFRGFDTSVDGDLSELMEYVREAHDRTVTQPIEPNYVSAGSSGGLQGEFYGTMVKERIPQELDLGEYWYRLYFNEPYYLEDNASGTPQYVNSLQVILPPESSEDDYPFYEGAQVMIGGYLSWGYAESRVIQAEKIVLEQ
jgi:hypothetical protein